MAKGGVTRSGAGPCCCSVPVSCWVTLEPTAGGRVGAWTGAGEQGACERVPAAGPEHCPSLWETLSPPVFPSLLSLSLPATCAPLSRTHLPLMPPWSLPAHPQEPSQGEAEDMRAERRPPRPRRTYCGRFCTLWTCGPALNAIMPDI